MSASAADPCWDTYPETVLELGEEPVRIDLRMPIGPGERRALRRVGLGRPFAVVTACNPRGRRLSTEQNRRRCLRLQRQVVTAGIAALKADGVSIDGSHREPGLALAVQASEAMRIAAAYEQSAIFWFDGRRFRVLPVLETNAGAVELPARQTPSGPSRPRPSAGAQARRHAGTPTAAAAGAATRRAAATKNRDR